MNKKTTKKVVSKKLLTKAELDVKINKDNYEATNLSKHEVADLIAWRDRASKRVDKDRARMDALAKEFDLLSKKSHSDIKWIRRLHNELSRKVFGHRDHSDRLPSQKEDPITKKIQQHIEEIQKLTMLEEAIR